MISRIGRVDRAVADNTAAIKESFGEQALLVQDFIIFIMKNLKENLFGFTEFTLAEFCAATGNTRQQLSIVDPIFKPGSKLKPPVKSGVTFSTVFDYALYSMMQKNIILSNKYTTKKGEQTIHLESIGIISDINIILGAAGKKRYQVKISPDIIEGFVSRYYTMDPNAYRLLGKGKKSDMRKTFLIFLCKVRHILFSNAVTEKIYALDVLAAEAGIQAKQTYHTKQSLTRILDKIKETGFPFDYEFVSIKKNAAQYHVKLVFEKVFPDTISKEHLFFYSLMDDLSLYFKATYGDKNFKDKEPFQRWLTNAEYNVDVKLQILKKLYNKFFSTPLTDVEAMAIITNGFLDDSDESIINEENFDFNP